MSKFCFLSILLVIACSNNNSRQVTIDNFQLNQRVNGKVLMVKDTSNYSPRFINDLRELSPEYDTLLLLDENLIITSKPFNGKEYISNTDTTKIPLILPQNIAVHYQLKNEIQDYTLILKRINYTDIQYELKSNNQAIKTGHAILSGGFILGMETDEDDNGFAFGVVEYLDKENCWTSLRIELGSGERVSINIFCDNDTTKNMNLTQLKKITNAL